VTEKEAEPLFLTIGRILGPWGTEGEVRVQVLTDFPESLAAQSQVYLRGSPLTIERSRHQGKHLIIKLSTVNDRGAADRLREHDLEIPLSEARTLPEGEYYPLQLIGLKVQTQAGETLGEVIDIWLRESNDIYVVRGRRGEILVPAIEDVVKSIDLEKGTMVIEVMNGLLE